MNPVLALIKFPFLQLQSCTRTTGEWQDRENFGGPAVNGEDLGEFLANSKRIWAGELTGTPFEYEFDACPCKIANVNFHEITFWAWKVKSIDVANWWQEWREALIPDSGEIWTLETDLGILLASPFKAGSLGLELFVSGLRWCSDSQETLSSQLERGKVDAYLLTEGLQQAGAKLMHSLGKTSFKPAPNQKCTGYHWLSNKVATDSISWTQFLEPTTQAWQWFLTRRTGSVLCRSCLIHHTHAKERFESIWCQSMMSAFKSSTSSSLGHPWTNSMASQLQVLEIPSAVSYVLPFSKHPGMPHVQSCAGHGWPSNLSRGHQN